MAILEHNTLYMAFQCCLAGIGSACQWSLTSECICVFTLTLGYIRSDKQDSCKVVAVAPKSFLRNPGTADGGNFHAFTIGKHTHTQLHSDKSWQKYSMSMYIQVPEVSQACLTLFLSRLLVPLFFKGHCVWYRRERDCHSSLSFPYPSSLFLYPHTDFSVLENFSWTASLLFLLP